jgi:hypothetical protein
MIITIPLILILLLIIIIIIMSDRIGFCRMLDIYQGKRNLIKGISHTLLRLYSFTRKYCATPGRWKFLRHIIAMQYLKIHTLYVL